MNLRKNLKEIKNKIKITSKKINTIKLLVVSKNRSINDIQKLISYGQYEFGENYTQESKDKITKINNNNVNWHYIGHIQSNKTKIIAEHFSWCHTITNKKTAILLNKHRSKTLPKLNVLIQIDIRNEHHLFNENIIYINELSKEINQLKQLNLRGIMAMPFFRKKYSDQIKSYQNMQLYFNYLKSKYPLIDTLSIGTSHDINAAIHSGSTLLRIGTAIFDTENDLLKS